VNPNVGNMHVKQWGCRMRIQVPYNGPKGWQGVLLI